ncbi:MAG: sigma-70 family RNA polymerase sigma factor [Pirellulaceae bacterium]|nr:sigma-70 family RNA polymerase sigma factor [Pirellulaceae bacterium]
MTHGTTINASPEAPAAALNWTELLVEHRGWLGTVIRSRLRDASAVDDLLQEVAIAVLKQPNRPDKAEKVAPWLYRIAVRKVINYHRHVGRRRKLIEGFIEERGDAAGLEKTAPGTWLLKKEQAQYVLKAMELLDAGDRQILMLKYTEGWGYRELAEHLGTTIKTVEYRLLRARQSLRDALSVKNG